MVSAVGFASDQCIEDGIIGWTARNPLLSLRSCRGQSAGVNLIWGEGVSREGGGGGKKLTYLS